jgi:hypothetical protein
MILYSCIPESINIYPPPPKKRRQKQKFRIKIGFATPPAYFYNKKDVSDSLFTRYAISITQFTKTICSGRRVLFLAPF